MAVTTDRRKGEQREAGRKGRVGWRGVGWGDGEMGLVVPDRVVRARQPQTGAAL